MKDLNQAKIKNRYIKFIAIVVFNISFLSLSAQSYYVAPNGNDNNTGTETEPWKTIAKANSTLQAGNTLFIRQGTYHENIDPKNSGTASNKITYQNYQNETVKVVGSSANKNVVKITKSYIVVKGLTLYHHDKPGCSGYSACAPFRIMIVTILGSNSGYNEILNNKIVSPYALVQKDTELFMREGGVGITSGSHHNLIQGNEIRNMSFNGIGLSKGVKFNKIINNQVIDYYQDGVHIGQGLDVITGTLIEGNIFSGSVRSDGIQCDDSSQTLCKGIIIRNNEIANNAENNIDLKGTQYIIIEGNTLYGSIGDNDGATRLHDRLNVYNDRESGFTIGHGGNSISKDVIIRNNIIYDNSGGIGARTGNGSGWIVYNNTIVNNTRDYEGSNSTFTRGIAKPVFTGVSSATSKKNAILNNIVGDAPGGELAVQGSTINCDYNLFFNTYKSVALAHYKAKRDWDLLSLEQWIDRLNIDTHSSAGDPQFVNVPSRPIGKPTQYDFSLKSNSPAIDKGGFLTTASTSGSGKQIQVKDARFFHDGFGVTQGDLIQFKGQTQTVRITKVNYGTNTLTVDTSLTWTSGLEISLAYKGAAPDIGALEYGGTLDAVEFENVISIAIYPNPSAEEINIQFPEAIKIKRVSVYDILGKEIFIKEIEASENKITLNPKLTSGIYFLKIDSNKGLISKKIIIE